ncbi:MAG: hypothetical protein A3H17_02370 [Candidatus Levybacteria bacterium RIFCSPLOWO2_12_FULL_37_14]|nr:MAG: RNA polymerase sigma factor [Candidatus Levybacteria bacterium GW2011_GWA1_37_16]OGH49879.1 MAG: hypothetical protein A3H17_02370 [Candidatus Levybacteria bacterium RIFCSPLOWO2_12_FULL_37_14]
MGMEQETSYNLNPITELLRTGSVGELNIFFEKVVRNKLEKHPGSSLYSLLKSATSEIPLKVSIKIQQEALAAIRSEDKKTKLAGQNVFLFLTIKTILGTVDSVFTEEKDTEEDREDMLSSAITCVLTHASGIKKTNQISARVAGLAQIGIFSYLQKKYDFPLGFGGASFARKIEFLRRMEEIREKLEANELTNRELSIFVKEVSEETTISSSDLLRYVEHRLPLLLRTDATFEPLLVEESIDEAWKRERVREVVGTLTSREQKVIDLRFGFSRGGDEMTQEDVGKEIGCTRTNASRLEARIIRMLKHPSRSRKLTSLS